MRILTFAALAGIAVGLGGCATLDEGQCRMGDWEGIGRSDGAAGYARIRLDDHAKACSKFDVTPDPAAYDRGRREGLTYFCTPRRGFEEARQNRAYGNVCPANLERGFLEGYADGGLVAAATRRLNDARSDRDAARNRAEDFERQIRENEAKLGDAATKNEEKGAIRDRLRTLREDRDRSWDDHRRSERRERDFEREVEGLRAQFTPVYGPW